MKNYENMNLELTRIEVLNVKIALLHIIFEAKDELRDENTSEDRKKVLEGTIKKWTKLRDKIEKQFDEQDAE